MKVEELVKQGANVDISFHDCATLQEAYKVLQPFKHIGPIKRRKYNGSQWLIIQKADYSIAICAYYENQTKK